MIVSIPRQSRGGGKSLLSSCPSDLVRIASKAQNRLPLLRPLRICAGTSCACIGDEGGPPSTKGSAAGFEFHVMTQSAVRIASILLICAATTPVVAGPRGGGHFGAGGVHFGGGGGGFAAPHLAAPHVAAPHFSAPSFGPAFSDATFLSASHSAAHSCVACITAPHFGAAQRTQHAYPVDYPARAAAFRSAGAPASITNHCRPNRLRAGCGRF